MSASNPFAQQLKALAATAQEEPPYSYRSRLIAQFTLSGLLAVMSTLWMILTVIDHRARGKQIKLIRLQKVPGGRMIVFNCIFVFVILATISGIVLIAGRHSFYAHYYTKSKDPIRNQLIFQIASQLPMGTSATIFSFSNLAGSIAVRRQQKGLTSFSAPLVWTYDVGLAFTLSLLWIGITTATVMANNCLNRVMWIRETASSTLYQAAHTYEVNPRDPSLSTVVLTLGQLKVEGAEKLKDFKHFFGIVAILACILMSIFIAASLASLSFVLMLRKQSHGKARSMADTIRTFNAHTRAGENSEDYDLGQRSLTSGNGVSKSAARRLVNEANGAVADDRIESIALVRLASNLTVSVPCIVILSVHVCIYVIHVYYTIERRDWKVQEYNRDGFSWTVLMINNTLLACFLYNHLFGTGSAKGQSFFGTASRASGSTKKSRGVSLVEHWSSPSSASNTREALSGSETAVHVQLDHHVIVDGKEGPHELGWEKEPALCKA